MALTKYSLRDNYTSIPNELISDIKLSIKARFLFVYIASKPNTWQVNNTDIKKQLNIKSDETIAKLWKELISNGWIKRVAKKTFANKFIGGFDYQVNETKNLEIPKKHEYGKNTIPKKHEYGKNTIPKKHEYGNNHEHSNNNSISNTNNNSNTNIVTTLKSDNEISKMATIEMQEAHKIVNYLHTNIKSVNPKFNRKTETWIKPILSLLTIDKISYSEVIAVIDYIYKEQGQFWIPNILSGKKLRDKYPTLSMQMLSNSNKNSSSMINQVLKAEQMGVTV